MTTRPHLQRSHVVPWRRLAPIGAGRILRDTLARWNFLPNRSDAVTKRDSAGNGPSGLRDGHAGGHFVGMRLREVQHWAEPADFPSSVIVLGRVKTVGHAERIE